MAHSISTGASINYGYPFAAMGHDRVSISSYSVIPDDGTISFFEASVNSTASTCDLYFENVDGAETAGVTGLHSTAQYKQNTSDTVSVSAGDRCRVVPAGSGSSSTFMWNYRFQSSNTNCAQVLCAYHRWRILWWMTPHYAAILGDMDSEIGGTSEVNMQRPMPTSGTFKNLYADTDQLDDYATVVLRVNGSDTALTVTVQNDEYQKADTTNEVHVDAGDLVNYKLTNLCSRGEIALGITFVPDTSGESIMLGGTTEWRSYADGNQLDNVYEWDWVDTGTLFPNLARLQKFYTYANVVNSADFYITKTDYVTTGMLHNAHTSAGQSLVSDTSSIYFCDSGDGYVFRFVPGGGGVYQVLWGFVVVTLSPQTFTETVVCNDDSSVVQELYRTLEETIVSLALMVKRATEFPFHYFEVSDASQFTINESDVLGLSSITEDDSSLRNHVTVVGSSVSVTTTDSVSINEYGTYTYKLTDDNITTTADAELLAGRILTEYSYPKKRGSITINGKLDIDVAEQFTLNLPNIGITNEKFQIVQYAHNITNAGFYTTIQFGALDYDIAREIAVLTREVRE